MPDEDKPSRAMRIAPVEGEVLSARRRGAISPRAHEELDEGPSPEDIERFSNVTRTCPECEKEVFDDADVCYHCGHALGARAEARTPVWVVVLAVVLVLGLTLPLVLGAFLR